MLFGGSIVSIYNLVLGFILMLTNWLFFSSYYNIFTVLNTKTTYFNSRKLIFYNMLGLLVFILIYSIIIVFFEFNNIKDFEIIPFIFINIFIFCILVFFSIFLFFFEKIKIIHLVIIVFLSVVIISFIYPFLLSIAYDKYE